MSKPQASSIYLFEDMKVGGGGGFLGLRVLGKPWLR